MMQGKVQNPLRYLSQTSGGVLNLDDRIPDATGNINQPHMRTTHDMLLAKHLPGALPVESSLLQDTPEPIIFDNLNADTIHQAPRRTASAGAGRDGCSR